MVIMKYFLHDTSSFDDEKITELYLKFGYEGLGLFYTALEKIGKQEKPVKTDILKSQLRIGKRLNKCWNFMEEIGLISSNNGESFNEQLLNFSEKYQIKKEKTRKKVQEWRDKQENKEIVTGYVPVSNPLKVKESKVNKKEIKKESDFLIFWDSYHSLTGLRKTNQQPAFKYWNKLSELEKQKALNNIKPYYDSLNDKIYCKIARTYLSDKNFNDEFKLSVIPKKTETIRGAYGGLLPNPDHIEDIYRRG
jgi:hypothetical protein